MKTSDLAGPVDLLLDAPEGHQSGDRSLRFWLASDQLSARSAWGHGNSHRVLLRYPPLPLAPCVRYRLATLPAGLLPQEMPDQTLLDVITTLEGKLLAGACVPNEVVLPWLRRATLAAGVILLAIRRIRYAEGLVGFVPGLLDEIAARGDTAALADLQALCIESGVPELMARVARDRMQEVAARTQPQSARQALARPYRSRL